MYAHTRVCVCIYIYTHTHVCVCVCVRVQCCVTLLAKSHFGLSNCPAMDHGAG